MMEIFLNFMQAISDSRGWLMLILLICTVVILARVIIGIAQDEIEEARDQGPEVRDLTSDV